MDQLGTAALTQPPEDDCKVIVCCLFSSERGFKGSVGGSSSEEQGEPEGPGSESRHPPHGSAKVLRPERVQRSAPEHSEVSHEGAEL